MNPSLIIWYLFLEEACVTYQRYLRLEIPLVRTGRKAVRFPIIFSLCVTNGVILWILSSWQCFKPWWSSLTPPRNTMKRFNGACNDIDDTVFRLHSANKLEIHKTVYYPVRERFGLSAQLTIGAISKVCEVTRETNLSNPNFGLMVL